MASEVGKVKLSAVSSYVYNITHNIENAVSLGTIKVVYVISKILFIIMIKIPQN